MPRITLAGIITGLKKVGQPLSRGLLLLAEMSTAGTLAAGPYATKTLEMARAERDFCIGFIGQSRLESASSSDQEDFIYMTPGVNLEVAGDAMGQQYRTPRQVILDAGLDCIIVGRGIYGSMEPVQMVEKAKAYREAGWSAYQDRTAP